jgi:hypothetical protein
MDGTVPSEPMLMAIVYAYINTTGKQASYVRSGCWWGSNCAYFPFRVPSAADPPVCFLTTLWKVTTAVNGGRSLLG